MNQYTVDFVTAIHINVPQVEANTQEEAEALIEQDLITRFPSNWLIEKVVE